jgi:hypothetical protein
MRLWRLIPAVAVGAVLALSKSPLPGSKLQASLEFVVWMAVFWTYGLSVLFAAATASGRSWSEGRMVEWRLSPLDRRLLVEGQVWSCALPHGAAVTIGGLVGSLLWWSVRRAGIAAPQIVPCEGLLLLPDLWAVVYLAASMGVWSGNRARRTRSAALVAGTVAVPILILASANAAAAFDHGLLGGHVLLIGGAWLFGNAFQAASARLLGC